MWLERVFWLGLGATVAGYAALWLPGSQGLRMGLTVVVVGGPAVSMAAEWASNRLARRERPTPPSGLRLDALTAQQTAALAQVAVAERQARRVDWVARGAGVLLALGFASLVAYAQFSTVRPPLDAAVVGRGLLGAWLLAALPAPLVLRSGHRVQRARATLAQWGQLIALAQASEGHSEP